jgi:prepilin-type N-terminal cleavage/methylation domain-containing protein
MTRAAKTNRRAGMSLVELLVVVAILGLLAVTVLPNLANTAESRRTREAARVVSSFVSSAKSRAIGRREWSGFALVPTGDGSNRALEVFYAETPPVYTGDTVDATLTITGSTATTRTASDSVSIASYLELGGQADDLIRFSGRGPWYQIDHNPVPGPPITPTSVRFEPRGFASGANEDMGQEVRNTPWPPSGAPLTFEIERQPVLTGDPLQLGEGRCVDLQWSGFGPANINLYRRFSRRTTGANAPVARVTVLFDSIGRVRQIVTRFIITTSPTATYTSERFTATGQILLLIGRADRVANAEQTGLLDDSNGANWQYGDSFWVAIDPFSGVAKVAECVANTSGVTLEDRLIASQALIREALLKDGR